VSDINFASTYTNKTLSAFTSIPPKAAIGLSLLLGGVVLSDLLNLEYFEFSIVRLGLDHIRVRAAKTAFVAFFSRSILDTAPPVSRCR
jgi:hypothetical protein